MVCNCSASIVDEVLRPPIRNGTDINGGRNQDENTNFISWRIRMRATILYRGLQLYTVDILTFIYAVHTLFL